MRRALLTARPGLPSFTVGDSAVSRTGSAAASGGYWYINRDNPAPRDGTLSSVAIYAATAGTVSSIFTCSISGTTATVRSASGQVSLTAGLNTIPVSLSIASGEFVGFSLPASGTGAVSRDNSGGADSYVANSAAPSPGASVGGISSASRPMSIQGTGS